MKDIETVEGQENDFYYEVDENKLGIILKKETKEEHILFEVLGPKIIQFKNGIRIKEDEKIQINHRKMDKEIEGFLFNNGYQIEYLN